MLQQSELSRTKARIGEAVVDFAASVIGRDFHGDELRAHVARLVGPIAPGSADRVMRMLKHSGRLSYSLVSRRQSVYRMHSVTLSRPIVRVWGARA